MSFADRLRLLYSKKEVRIGLGVLETHEDEHLGDLSGTFDCTVFAYRAA